MAKILLEAYFPIWIPSTAEDYFINLHFDTIKSLLNSSENIVFEGDYFPTSNPKFQIFKKGKYPKSYREFRPKSKDKFRDHDLLYIYIDTNISEEFNENQNEFSLLMEFEKILRDLFLALNIAHPSGLTLGHGLVSINKKHTRDYPGVFSESLNFAVEYGLRHDWPPILQLELTDVWHWLNLLPNFKDGVGTNRFGRAIAAFSRILKRRHFDDSTMDIVWALMGLEALYGHGNLSLKDQLISKTQLVLGKRTSFKKHLGTMYDYRSRLLHGDIDIPIAHTFDTTPQYENFINELEHNSDISIATLISSLQMLVKNHLTVLSFSYKIDQPIPFRPNPSLNSGPTA